MSLLRGLPKGTRLAFQCEINEFTFFFFFRELSEQGGFSYEVSKFTPISLPYDTLITLVSTAVRHCVLITR